MRTHDARKPYTCMHCGYAFSHNGTRKRHQAKCDGQLPAHIAAKHNRLRPEQNNDTNNNSADDRTVTDSGSDCGSISTFSASTHAHLTPMERAVRELQRMQEQHEQHEQHEHERRQQGQPTKPTKPRVHVPRPLRPLLPLPGWEKGAPMDVTAEDKTPNQTVSTTATTPTTTTTPADKTTSKNYEMPVQHVQHVQPAQSIQALLPMSPAPTVSWLMPQLWSTHGYCADAWGRVWFAPSTFAYPWMYY